MNSSGYGVSVFDPKAITDGASVLPRCRDCEGYADPTATHSDCTFTGVRKAGYAGACKTRILRVTTTPTRKEMSMTSTPIVKWTPEEDRTLRAFAHEGKVAVAARLGRSITSVQQHASKRGISLAKHEPAIRADETTTEASVPVTSTPTETAPLLSTLLLSTLGAKVTTEHLGDGTFLHTFTAKEVEREADELAEALTTAQVVADLKDEIAHLRVEILLTALHSVVPDAELFAAAYVFPAIEARENAAEARCSL